MKISLATNYIRDKLEVSYKSKEQQKTVGKITYFHTAKATQVALERSRKISKWELECLRVNGGSLKSGNCLV